MSTPLAINVTPYLARVNEDADKKHAPRWRFRWRAELTEAGVSRGAIEGADCPVTAIGELVRWVARECETSDDVLDLVASLFGDLRYRGPDITLGRALYLAARNPRRKHAGCTVTIGEPASAPMPAAKVAGPKRLAMPKAAAKGGAL